MDQVIIEGVGTSEAVKQVREMKIETIKTLRIAVSENTEKLDMVIDTVNELLVVLKKVTVEVEEEGETPATPISTPEPEIQLTMRDITITPVEVTKLCVAATEAGVDKQLIKDRIKDLGSGVSALSPSELHVLKEFIIDEVKKVGKRG